MRKRELMLVFIITTGFLLGGGCNWFSNNNDVNLTINIEGEGQVFPESGTFGFNSTVELEVKPREGWKFVEWEGNNKNDVIPILGEPEKFSILMN